MSFCSFIDPLQCEAKFELLETPFLFGCRCTDIESARGTSFVVSSMPLMKDHGVGSDHSEITNSR